MQIAHCIRGKASACEMAGNALLNRACRCGTAAPGTDPRRLANRYGMPQYTMEYSAALLCTVDSRDSAAATIRESTRKYSSAAKAITHVAVSSGRSRIPKQPAATTPEGAALMAVARARDYADCAAGARMGKPSVRGRLRQEALLGEQGLK